MVILMGYIIFMVITIFLAFTMERSKMSKFLIFYIGIVYGGLYVLLMALLKG